MKAGFKLSLNVLPLLTRELRVAARNPLAYRERLAVGGGAMIFIAVVTWGANLSGLVTGGGGGTLLMVLSYAALYYSGLVGLVLTADSLAREKREGTLGLLFMAGLSGGEIILGKWLVGALRAVYGLLAAGPALAVCIAFGGVEGITVVKVMVALLVALAFCLAVGVCLSAFAAKSERLGGIVGLVAPLFLIGLPSIAWWLREEIHWPVAAYMLELFSPATPLRAVFHPPADTTPEYFLDAVWGNLATTMGLLWLAGRTLQRSWQNETVASTHRVARAWREFRFGNPPRRAALRSKLLAVNPWCWLNSRDRFATHAAWLVLLLTYGVIFGAWRWLTPYAEPTPYWFVAAFASDVFLKLAIGGEAGMGIWRHRETGAMELILATPLSDRDVIHGQWLALRRRFMGPVIVMAVINLVMLAMVHSIPQWRFGDITESVFVLCYIAVSLLDYIALAWVGIWQGVRATKVNEAASAAGHVFGRSGGVFFAGLIVLLILGWRPDSDRQMLLLLGWGTLCCIVSDLLFIRWARKNLFERFRQTISETRSATAELPGASAKTAAKSKPLTTLSQSLLRLARKWRWALATAAVLLLGVTGHRLWLNHRVNVALKALEATGQPVKLADLKKLFPYVPLEQDAGPAMRAALEAMVLPPSTQTNNLISLYADFKLRSDPFTSDMKASLDEVLEANQKRIKELREAMKRDKAYFDYNWEDYSGQMSLYRGLSAVDDVLRLSAWVHLEHGRKDEAVACVLDLYRLTHFLVEAPGLISYFHQQSLLGASFALERLLARSDFTEAQLQVIAAAIRQAEADSDKAVRGRFMSLRCEYIHFMSLSVSLDELINQRTRGMSTEARMTIAMMLSMRRLTGLQQRELLLYLEAARRAEDTLKLAPSVRVKAQFDLQDEFRRNTPKHSTDLVNRIGGTISALTGPIWTQTRLRLSETAVAIERFRLKHGRYPSGLKELVPNFLTAVPLDPYDGQPLRYTPLPKGFSLHSIGADFKDDGGIRDEKENRRKDILFTVEH